jgi:hypothetical protein
MFCDVLFTGGADYLKLPRPKVTVEDGKKTVVSFSRNDEGKIEKVRLGNLLPKINYGSLYGLLLEFCQ